MPKYKEISEKIEQAILTGRYKGKLPTEEELMREFSTSRNTLRNAINLLVDSAKLYRVQGSGVYIREVENDRSLDMGQVLSTAHQLTHSNISNKVVSLEKIEADEQLASELKVSSGTILYKLKRIRYVDDIPFLIEYSFFNKEIIPYIGEEIAAKSIYDYIENDLNYKIGFADRYITAEKLTPEDAKILKLSAGDPALVNREKIYLSNGMLFNSSRVIHNYQTTEMYVSAKN